MIELVPFLGWFLAATPQENLLARHVGGSNRKYNKPTLVARLAVTAFFLTGPARRTSRAQRQSRLGVPGKAGLTGRASASCQHPSAHIYIYIYTVLLHI